MNYVFWLAILTFSLLSCEEERSAPPQLENNDRTAVEENLRKILALNLNDSIRDFEVSSTDGDSLYSGIDWVKFDSRYKDLVKDSLFTTTFLDEYKAIAFGINLSLKNKEIEYRVGEINPFFEANVWCDCQDFDSWKKELKINSIRMIEGQAVVNFSLNKGTSIEAKFTQVRNNWRCSSWSTLKLP